MIYIVVHGDIQFNRLKHEYIHLPTKTKLTAVSTIIKLVYNKKSWDGVDEAVIENARDRGTKVDDYIAEYIRTDAVEMPAGERQDVIDRVIIAQQLLEKHYGDRVAAKSQHIVSDVGSGIAGTADMVIDGCVVDLKVTYNPEVDWALQIGAYATLGGYDNAAILHVSPKFYKDCGGGRLIIYSVPDCKRWWAEAVHWWQVTKEMENGTKKGKRIPA